MSASLLEIRFLRPRQLDALRSSGRGHGVLIELLLFLLVFAAGTVATVGMQYVTATVLTVVSDLGGLEIPFDRLVLYVSLLCTSGTIFAVLLALRFGFRRPLSTVGFVRPAGREYALGLLLGLALMSAVVGLAAAFGGLRVAPASDFSLAPLLILFLGFLVQGMSEELLCRGYLMTSIARKNPVTAGVVVNALVFMLLHMANDGTNPLAFLNLFLFGVFASFYYLWRGSIWGVAAIHSMWNFAQGNLFGVLVSGIDLGPSLVRSSLTEGKDLVNGGAFGLEGGVCTTVVMVLAIALVLWRMSREKTQEISKGAGGKPAPFLRV